MLVTVVMLCNALRPSTLNLTMPCETWSFLMIVIRAHSQFSRPTLPSLAEVDGYYLSSRGPSRYLILHSEVTSLQWRHATIFCVSCWKHDHLLCVVVRTLRRLAVRREKTVNSCLCYFYCRQYLFWSFMNAWIFIPYIFRVCTSKVSRFIKRNSWSEGELLLFMFSEK